MGSTPNLSPGYVPTAAQWNSYFAAKQDQLAYTPLNPAGGTMTGELFTAPSTTSSAGLNIGVGVAPSSPANGDMWATSSGAFIRVAGSTIQLGSGGTGGGGGVTFTGGTLSGNLTTAASTTAISGLNVAPGSAPTSPNNGDVWTTASGLFARINGTSINVAAIGTIDSLTLKASPASSDEVPIWDVSGSAIKKATVGTLGPSDVLKFDATATISVGYTLTPFNQGTVSSGTLTPAAANGNYQYYTNNGAHTLAAPAADSAIDILVTNGASAGTITFSGYTVGSNTGDALTTTNTSKFIISIRRINGISTYVLKALQ